MYVSTISLSGKIPTFNIVKPNNQRYKLDHSLSINSASNQEIVSHKSFIMPFLGIPFTAPEQIAANTKTLYTTDFLELKSAQSPDGVPWYYVHRPNDKPTHDSAVALTTLVKKDNGYNFLFLKTQRPPIYGENKARYCLECPAGMIGDENPDETLEESAKRELLEETGYISDKIYYELKNSASSAGSSSETITYCTVIVNDDKQYSEPVSDGGIIVERIYVPVDKVDDFLNSIDTTKISIGVQTICGIYYALRRINKMQLNI